MHPSAAMTTATRQMNARGSRGPRSDVASDKSVVMLVSDDDDSSFVGAKRKRMSAIIVASDDNDNSDESDGNGSSATPRRSRRERSSSSTNRTKTHTSPGRASRVRTYAAPVPSRSPSAESRDAAPAAKTSSRRTRTIEQSVSVANLQAQEREISLLKARMISEERAKEKERVTLSLRKGVRQSVPPSPSSKRSRARSMRPGSMRRSPRSPAAEDPRLAGVRKGVPMVDLDDDTAPRTQCFATTADAVQAAVLHSTAWRNVKLDVAPPNVLADAPGIAVPFATHFDGPLSSYDDERVLPAKCAIVSVFAQPPPLSLMTGSPKEAALRAAIEERVAVLVDEAAPLIKLAHLRRAKTIIMNARRQVRSYLAALPAHRERVEEIAGSFRPLQISRLEKVATRMILKNRSSDSTEAFIYTVGRGESALSERDIVHNHAVQLSKVTGISRSTTCMETRGLIRVDDDPIIRFVPLFSDDASKQPDAARFDDQFDGFGGDAKGFLAATDDERKELLLRYVVAGVRGDAAVFGVLQELGHFKQPLTDYVELSNREMRATRQRARLAELERIASATSTTAYTVSERSAIIRLVQSYSARASGALLRDRLALPPVHYDVLHVVASTDGSEHRDGMALRATAHDSYADMAARYQNFFCRRCFAYNCQSHGINQPLPSTRADPRYPPVKAALRLQRAVDAKTAGLNAGAPTANGEGSVSANDDVIQVDDNDGELASEPSFGKEITGIAAPQDDDGAATTHTGEPAADENDDDSNAVRRSVRSLTAASTKASTILVSQRSKEKRKSPAARAYRGPHSDVSEYLGHDTLYRSMTMATRTRLLTADEQCGPTCSKLSASGDAPISAASPTGAVWTPVETLLLDKVVQSLGAQPCVIAAVLRTKSCAAVSAALTERCASAALTGDALIGSARASARDVARPVGARGNNHEHLRRTRLQRMKDRGANHEFVACHHDGVSCNSGDCSCMRRDHYCEKACGCPADCANRFPGCKCAPGQCRSAACPCFFGGRECDPDVCVACGACELPVDVMDPASQRAWREQHVMCGNVNLLRGAMRKVGVAASATHGWGAFALEPIVKGDFIYEYTGELLSQDEAERRGNIYDKSTVSFLFDLNEDAVVDATRKGNKSKFANHTAAAPKCIARILRVNGEHRIGIFANAAIAVDEELFFDYGYSGVVPDWTRGGHGERATTATAPVWQPDSDVAAELDDSAAATTTPQAAADKKTVKRDDDGSGDSDTNVEGKRDGDDGGTRAASPEVL